MIKTNIPFFALVSVFWYNGSLISNKVVQYMPFAVLVWNDYTSNYEYLSMFHLCILAFVWKQNGRK
jgi:hypothetical protein